MQHPIYYRRPLCEVVNWNMNSFLCWIGGKVDLYVRSWIEITNNKCNREKSASTSMWGRELKWSWSRIRSRLALVDLYVRSWIEISLFFMWMLIRQCRPLCEVVNWNYQFVENEGLTFVDLYVRSWIEILMHIMQQRRWAGRSTSMWGRELKFIKNWSKKKQSSSTSMWGRELK